MHPNIAFLVRTTKEQSANIRKTHRALHRFIALLVNVRYIGAYLYKHSLLRRRNARSSGDEEGSAEHQTRVRSCGCAVIFLHQSDKWHNEATSLNVREPSVALPVGLCRRQKGETREEGGHILSRDYALRAIAHFYFLLTISPVAGLTSNAQ